jgi:acyl-CoA thioester hydrolase
MTETLAARDIAPGFRHVFRVRFAECDPQGIVFNSRYLEYADMLVTEHWRVIGLAFAGEGSLDFNVVRAEVNFRAPVRADELLEGRLWVDRLGNSSMAIRIELHGGAVAGTDAADLRTVIALVHVHVDVACGRPLPIPAHVRALLSAESGIA